VIEVGFALAGGVGLDELPAQADTKNNPIITEQRCGQENINNLPNRAT
jgi:hypothetical protein